MPKSRNEEAVERCSFCGQHRNEVPQMITSVQTKAAICSWCALGVVNQTFRMIEVLKRKFDAARAGPQLEVVSELPKPDALESAVNKALRDGRKS